MTQLRPRLDEVADNGQPFEGHFGLCDLPLSGPIHVTGAVLDGKQDRPHVVSVGERGTDVHGLLHTQFKTCHTVVKYGGEQWAPVDGDVSGPVFRHQVLGQVTAVMGHCQLQGATALFVASPQVSAVLQEELHDVLVAGITGRQEGRVPVDVGVIHPRPVVQKQAGHVQLPLRAAVVQPDGQPQGVRGHAIWRLDADPMVQQQLHRAKLLVVAGGL